MHCVDPQLSALRLCPPPTIGSPLLRHADRRRRLRGRRRAVASWLLLLLGAGVLGAPVSAQVAADPFAAYGGMNAGSRAGGVQISYDVEGVLPLPPPLLQVTVPTSRASTATGPSSLAFGSMAYPGDLVGNLPAIFEQSAPGSGGLMPPYPLAALAEYPTGPASHRQDVGTASAAVEASASGASAVSSLGGTSVPGLIEVGAVTAASRTGLEDGLVVARSRAEVSTISLLFGLVRLDDVVTDVVAATDGTTSSTGGGTTVGRASVLGLPATVGPDGLVIDAYAPPESAGPLAPLVDALAGLGATADQLGTVAEALGPVLADGLAATAAVVDDLLAEGGLRITVAPLAETQDGASAKAETSGLEISLAFDGSGDGPLAQLLALLPADDLPGNGIPGMPVNTSPQALVNLLKETHVVQVHLAPATARVDATPAFDAAPREPTTPRPSSELGPSFGGPAPPAAGFMTPLPILDGARPSVAAVSSGAFVPGRAIGFLVALLAVLSLPLWGRASARLLDASLTDAAPDCPDRIEGTARRGGPAGARQPG
jgi:hypothetical protein